jgi:hypothetical protein
MIVTGSWRAGPLRLLSGGLELSPWGSHDPRNSGWGFLMWMASIVSVLSLSIVLFAGLMRRVGRIGPRGLAGVLAVDAILWALATFFWWGRSEG